MTLLPFPSWGYSFSFENKALTEHLSDASLSGDVYAIIETKHLSSMVAKSLTL